MKLSDELRWRGLIKDHTFEDIEWLNYPKTFYLGVDCSSADSMTIGNLAVFMLARRLLDSGWQTVLLVGGATSLIGDPGGKDSERDLKSEEEIAKNVEGIKAQVEMLFSGKEYIPANNLDWFKDVGYLQFLREVGKNYSMTEMLQRDFIQQRIGESGSGISYAEFSYSLVQGYDYWQLFKRHGVVLQIGGSDQWGNMLSGVPLIRKKESKEVHAMSMPLVINKSTGRKFGKSEDGAVWLDANKTSVFKFYQFWLNLDDEGVIDYLKIYTLLSREEIESIISEFEQDRSGRLAQKTLAYEVTKLVHGQNQADKVRHTTEILFGDGELSSLDNAEWSVLGEELPKVKVDPGENTIVDVLVESGLASSKGEARRFMGNGAIYINGEQLGIDKLSLDQGNNISGYAVIRRGKNTSAIVQFNK